MIAASAGLELRMTLRNGEQLLLALVIPLVALIGGTLITVVDLPEPRIDTVTPGVLALAVLSSAVHLAGHHHRVRPAVRRAQTAGGRRDGRVQLIAGKCAATLARHRGQCVVLGGVALRAGLVARRHPLWASCCRCWAPRRSSASACCSAARVRAEVALGLANLAWLVFVAASAASSCRWTTRPAGCATIGELTPAGALSQSLRAVLQDGRRARSGLAAVLAAWCVVGWLAAVRWFRWQ